MTESYDVAHEKALCAHIVENAEHIANTYLTALLRHTDYKDNENAHIRLLVIDFIREEVEPLQPKQSLVVHDIAALKEHVTPSFKSAVIAESKESVVQLYSLVLICQKIQDLVTETSMNAESIARGLSYWKSNLYVDQSDNERLKITIKKIKDSAENIISNMRSICALLNEREEIQNKATKDKENVYNYAQLHEASDIIGSLQLQKVTKKDCKVMSDNINEAVSFMKKSSLDISEIMNSAQQIIHTLERRPFFFKKKYGMSINKRCKDVAQDLQTKTESINLIKTANTP